MKVPKHLSWQHVAYSMTLEGVRTTSASAEMTLPSVVSDLLMLAPSLRRVPVAPVESALSLPAKSTRLILLTCKHWQYMLEYLISAPNP